jgi:type I restriction enzyme, R subunit
MSIGPVRTMNNAGKPTGFVLNFVGIFKNLEKALAFDSQDVKIVVEGHRRSASSI